MAIHDITTRLLAVADQDAHISRASMKISLPKLLLHERKAQAAEHTKMTSYGVRPPQCFEAERLSK